MSFIKRLFGRSEPESFIVPEGVRVEVWRYEPLAGIAQSETGMWIVNFGADPLGDQIMESVRELEASLVDAVLFILSTTTKTKPAIYEEIARITESSGAKGVCVVVADAGPDDLPPMQELVAKGVEAFSAADDGACMVEIHGPEGITIGMPGRPFTELSVEPHRQD